MTVTFPGHSSPTAGFELPLEMLKACHLRAQDQCSPTPADSIGTAIDSTS